MDEVKLTLQQGRGIRAEELLRNELLQEAFETLRADYINAWQITSAKDSQAREQLYLAVNILGKVKDHLKKVAINGQIASKDLAGIKYLKP